MRDIMIIFEVPNFPEFNKSFNKIFFNKTYEEVNQEVDNLRKEYMSEIINCIFGHGLDYRYYSYFAVCADWFNISLELQHR